MSIETCEMFRKQGTMMYVWCVNRRHELGLWSEEGAIVGTDFCFPLRDDRGEGKEVREGRMEWSMLDERRFMDEQRELKEAHESTAPELRQQSAPGADGKVRPALIVD